MLLLDAWTRLTEPRPLLMIAPRRLDRIPELTRLLTASPWRWSSRSREPNPTEIEVLLLDTMGELDGFFPLATAAWIGGTLDPKLGGHSPALAFRSGLPVIAGPHRGSNPEAWKHGRTQEIGIDATGVHLARAIQRVLEMSPEPVKTRDSLESVIDQLPTPRTPPERPQRPFFWPLVPVCRLLMNGSRPSQDGEVSPPRSERRTSELCRPTAVSSEYSVAAGGGRHGAP